MCRLRLTKSQWLWLVCKRRLIIEKGKDIWTEKKGKPIHKIYRTEKRHLMTTKVAPISSWCFTNNNENLHTLYRMYRVRPESQEIYWAHSLSSVQRVMGIAFPYVWLRPEAKTWNQGGEKAWYWSQWSKRKTQTTGKKGYTETQSNLRSHIFAECMHYCNTPQNEELNQTRRTGVCI